MPFLSFYEYACLKNIWSACYRLCKIVSAGMQWIERNPTSTSRHSPLLPVQKRSLLKTEKLLQLQCSFTLYVAPIWLKDDVLFQLCHVLYSHMQFVTPLRFILLYAACGFCFCKRQNTYLKYFFLVWRAFLWSTAGLLFYMPPVSGNILVLLHGFNGHDREYALKVNPTSVRNWTC